MRLKEWVIAQANETGRHESEVLKDLSAKSEISIATIRNAYNGMRIAKYSVAVAIETATGSEVTVTELCT